MFVSARKLNSQIDTHDRNSTGTLLGQDQSMVLFSTPSANALTRRVQSKQIVCGWFLPQRDSWDAPRSLSRSNARQYTTDAR